MGTFLVSGRKTRTKSDMTTTHGEEGEDGVFEAAKDGEEGLREDEGEEHVDADGDALPRRASLKREGLAGDEPSERAP